MSTTADPQVFPSFYLYGEPQRSVAEGFVHVESLDDRSRPSEWTIRSHVHGELNHIILIAEGGGLMLAEEIRVNFEAPCLLLIPAGIVHGFSWLRESRGQVVTIADSYLHDLTDRDADFALLFRRAIAVALPRDGCRAAEASLRGMSRELSWSGPGQRAAVESGLLGLMVLALRGARLEEIGRTGKPRQTELVGRLREQIEQRFRLREPVDLFAKALGVSLTALRIACARSGVAPPAAMLDERALLEARRLLLYSDLSVAQIAHSIGFGDPAYFSRFFTRHVGQPPRAYRAAKGRSISTAARPCQPS
ncbi:helix-turn-helix domain-containing protein [Rhizorhapis suberifaciens]|uniref:AraC family transcriptional activator of pobA n=1 Tax=Rhizorhapis suberifaciens TaxID=13656 RepID=A0A840HRX0_9SPHN|nr:helix-turn-helix domain-containing protein [Rhizorhapis suberifaciens]MBB4640653.1 AraC family transcriptional activator of pobA [Rhizorhapis suberifaciens]